MAFMGAEIDHFCHPIAIPMRPADEIAYGRLVGLLPIDVVSGLVRIGVGTYVPITKVVAVRACTLVTTNFAVRFRPCWEGGQCQNDDVLFHGSSRQ